MKIDNAEEENLQISMKFSGKSRVMKKVFLGLNFWKFWFHLKYFSRNTQLLNFDILSSYLYLFKKPPGLGFIDVIDGCFLVGRASSITPRNWNLLTNYPVDTGRKLNVQDVFWTSSARFIYVLRILGKYFFEYFFFFFDFCSRKFFSCFNLKYFQKLTSIL